MDQKTSPSVRTYSGMRPYYRRTLRTFGNIAVYFRDSRGRKMGRLVVSPDMAPLFERGKTYTMEERVDG